MKFDLVVSELRERTDGETDVLNKYFAPSPPMGPEEVTRLCKVI